MKAPNFLIRDSKFFIKEEVRFINITNILLRIITKTGYIEFHWFAVFETSILLYKAAHKAIYTDSIIRVSIFHSTRYKNARIKIRKKKKKRKAAWM